MGFDEAGWVLNHSPLSGTALVVHVVLGELANQENEYALWPRQEWVAHRARTTRGTVGRVLADMVTAGLLEELPSTQFVMNRYRFLMDSARYPWRSPPPRTTKVRTRIMPAVPPMPPPPVRDFDARRDLRPCAISAHDTCAISAHRTKDLEQEVEAKSLATDKPSPKGTRGKAPTFTEAAERLARAEWDRREIKPVIPFVAMRARIDEVLAAGYSEADVERVLPMMAAFSRNAFDHMLGQAKGRRGLRSVPLPISADRDAPEGLVET